MLPLRAVATKFILVAAIDLNGGVGLRGALPWKAPAVLAREQQPPSGGIVLMGRRTYDSLPGPLVNRQMVVLTHNGKTPLPKGGELVFHLGSLLIAFPGREVFVIGGAETYRLMLPYVSSMHLTVVHGEYEADTFFPGVDFSAWACSSVETTPSDAANPALSFALFTRLQTTSVAEPRLLPGWVSTALNVHMDTST